MSDKPQIGIVYHPNYFIHTNDNHPEKKERLQAILTQLKEENLFPKLQQLAPYPATVEEVGKVHTKQHIEHLRGLCERRAPYLDPDTYLTPQSYDVALLSAGGALTAMRAVMDNKLKTCYALSRPPGHHAEPNKGMGFCLFNNGAIAARHALEEYNLSRILYLDWDVHHGNGVQKTFYHDSRVLFVSIHQSPAFPGTGHVNETGEGEGQGYTVNIPLPPGCGDHHYAKVLDEIVIPLADKFQPELLMVSAGQDAYHEDPLAGMCISFEGFAYMARHAKQIADKYTGGKAVLFLEGGYHLRGLSEAVVTILSEFGGWERPVNQEPAPNMTPMYDDPDAIIEAVKRVSMLLNS